MSAHAGGWIALLLLLEWAAPAWARYPRVARDAQGTWVAADECLVRVVGELFTFYTTRDGLPADRVRSVAADDREVWAATPRGLARMDRNSERWEAFTAPNPLPANDVRGVAVDDRYAWIATARGAARWDKINKRFEIVGRSQGPGEEPLFDTVSLGNTVWFGGQSGLWRLERGTGQWRSIGPAEGLDVGAVQELVQLGESLWLLGERGLARLDLRSEAVHTFTEKNGLPGPRAIAFAQVGGEIWIGGERGLAVYQPGSDAIGPFVYRDGMPAGPVVGIEVAAPWVFVATDQGLGLFNSLTRLWEAKRTDDGLAPSPLAGLALAGPQLVLLQADTLQSYHIQRDDFQTFAYDAIWAGEAGQKKSPSDFRLNLELVASGEAKVGFGDGAVTHTEQIAPDFRIGFGTLLEGGRSLDSSVRIDLGDATTPGVREYEAELRLRGAPGDTLRELVLSDRLRLEEREEQRSVFEPLWLEGLGAYQAIGPEQGSRPTIEISAEAGLRRDKREREFFRGSIELSYNLAHRYLTPKSEVVRVDGQILDRDIDYIITHTTGQLTFLNPDRVNALSLIEITYSYELVPRKDTASRSILLMLPWDQELGGFVRAGSPTYVSDEGGLYAQIDGAAPKYLDRGWTESVFQDYVQGSTRLAIQIHDMGSPENAESLFDYDRPLSYVVLWDEPDSTALRDESLPSSYAVKMRLDRFYVELSIDEKSKPAEILIGLFAASVRTKGSLAGSEQDALRDLLGRVRLGVNPSEHMGLGMSLLGASELEDRPLMRRLGLDRHTLELGALDLWTKHSLGGGALGGDLSSYFQVARSGLTVGREPQITGEAAAGDLAYNSEALTLRLEGEWQSTGFEALGARETALGLLESDLRADLSLRPWRFLELRLLYDRETSHLAPELDPTGAAKAGVVENLLSKLAFVRAGFPTVWLLFGRSALAGGGHEDVKTRLAGSFEYDLAHGLLDSLGMKKLALKAYVDRSENAVPIQVDEHSPILSPAGRERWLRLGSIPGTALDMRYELKLAPTSTEDAYARFERKTFEPESKGGAQSTPREAFELIAGASSRFLNGVVPTFNGKVTFSEGTQGDQLTQTAQSILSGQIELFPGRFFEALGSTALAVGYGYTNAEEAEGDEQAGTVLWMKKAHLQKDQVEAKGSVGNYDDLLRVELRSKWWSVHEQEAQTETERYLELQSRFVFRPIYTSPITLRCDYARLEQRHPSGQQVGLAQAVSPGLEWERRWSKNLVTKVRLESPLRLLDDAWDELRLIPETFLEVGLRPFAEVRLAIREIWGDGMLRLAYRGYHLWTFPVDADQGSGAERARELYQALWFDLDKPGVLLFRLGVVYLWHQCEELLIAGTDECRSQHSIEPSLKIIGRF